MVDGHQFGEFGENGGDQWIIGRYFGDFRGTDTDFGCGVYGVTTGDCEVILICFKLVEGLGARGGERNDLLVELNFWTESCQLKP